MTVNLSSLAGAGQQFFTDTGSPLTGGKLYSYAAGTTTPQASYTTAAGTTAHTNPIILNSAGRVATGEIWLTAGSNYKFVLYTSTDVLIATWDNITGINGTGITSNASTVVYDPAGTGAVATTVQTKLRESVSVKDFGAVGDGVTDDTAAFNSAAASAAYEIQVPYGTYNISSKVTINKSKLIGDGSSGTIIKAIAAIDAPIQFGSQNGIVEGIYFQGNSLANTCLILESANGTTVRNCRAEGGKYDGIKFGSSGNNNGIRISNCLIRNNGFTYEVGTVSGTSGTNTLTVSGAANLTTIGARGASTYVSFTGDPLAYEVYAISATTLSVYPALETSPSGAVYKIIDGANIYITRSADNGRSTIEGCNLQTHPCAGVIDFGLFGAMSINSIYQNNGYGRIIGRRQTPYVYATVSSSSIFDYFETQTYNDTLRAYAIESSVFIPGIPETMDVQSFSGSDRLVILASTAQSVIPANGIAFPSTEVASANVNTLDDYEEGSFLMTIEGTTSAGVGTYTTQIARYTKIGNLVSINGYVVWTAHTGTGNMRISNLPFSSVSTSPYRSSFALGYVEDIAINAGHSLTAQLANNSTSVILWQTPSGGGTPIAVPLDIAGYISVSGSYQV